MAGYPDGLEFPVSKVKAHALRQFFRGFLCMQRFSAQIPSGVKRVLHCFGAEAFPVLSGHIRGFLHPLIFRIQVYLIKFVVAGCVINVPVRVGDKHRPVRQLCSCFFQGPNPRSGIHKHGTAASLDQIHDVNAVFVDRINVIRDELNCVTVYIPDVQIIHGFPHFRTNALFCTKQVCACAQTCH